ncbi:uncharacterized protein LOC119402102 [Rhipicephalus sanguineus]|uniref:uncharacterized protein LOC119402102 n=1 Tax=Rhipicephalus sanguineus TaxID=34632 RepID=UPI0020C3ED37|nr:uncharacterized protein LOC119402102 [Rhipicephalus sanguineus]
MRNITKDAVYFNRSHEDPQTKARTNNLLEGLFEQTDASVMYVGGPDMTKNVIEQLEYASNGSECGVFLVRYTAGNNTGSGLWRELRVRARNGQVQPKRTACSIFLGKDTMFCITVHAQPPR